MGNGLANPLFTSTPVPTVVMRSTSLRAKIAAAKDRRRTLPASPAAVPAPPTLKGWPSEPFTLLPSRLVAYILGCYSFTRSLFGLTRLLNSF